MQKQLITATIMCAVCFAGMCFATEGDIPINDGVTASPQETEQKNNDVPSEPSAVTDPGGVQFSASQADSVSADNGVRALTPEQAAAPRTMNQQTTGTHPDDIASRLSALRGGARGSLNSDEGSDPSDPLNQGISGDRSSGGDAQDNGMDNGSFGEDSKIGSEGDVVNRESQFEIFSACMAGNVRFDLVQRALYYNNLGVQAMIVTLFENMNSDLNNADLNTFGTLIQDEMLQYIITHYSDEANIAAVIAEAEPHKAAAIAAAVANARPSQAFAIAAAVAMAVPSQATAIAAAVAKVEPSQAVAIAAAFAKALPSQAAAIAAAVAKAVPSQAVAIAQAVANAVPNQTAAILKAVKAVETLTENDRDVLSEMMETYENPPDTEPPYQG